PHPIRSCLTRRVPPRSAEAGVSLVEAAGQSRKQFAGDAGDLFEEATEFPRAQLEHLHVALGRDRGVSRAGIEQGQLSEVVAGAEGGNGAPASLDPRRAVHDQIELALALALADEDLA